MEIDFVIVITDFKEVVVMGIEAMEAARDSEDDDEPQNDATCLMAIDSQEVHPKPSISSNNLDIHELQKENEELVKSNNDFMKSL
ncbi:hypothetical protein Tco_0800353 [Tanacetum coccineum]|uniref:Uncharacterized protein n=1 Tax=Tanacetum coccineum TaxID=301880 RepID=A0ABQ4ZWM1_9ASTR